jgi:hypothetical protein
MNRPYPPAELLEEFEGRPLFVAAPDLEAWATETFISESGPLANPEHEYLRGARIGFLYTNVENSRHQRHITATAELGPPNPTGGKWKVAREEYQILQWFGEVPDFRITCYAPDFAAMSDIDLCATVEHELYHCHVQYKDGFPRFKADGSYFWAMRGHDVEEHVGIVRRYGAPAGAGKTMELVEAAKQVPTVGRASIAAACGTCALRLA